MIERERDTAEERERQRDRERKRERERERGREKERGKDGAQSSETIQFLLLLLLLSRVFGTIVRRVINRETRRGFFFPLAPSNRPPSLSNGGAIKTGTGVTAA